MRDFDNFCPTCAAVTHVRAINEDGVNIEYSGVAGPEDIAGHAVLIQPMISSSNHSTHITSATQWRITVRYNNGTYAGFNQQQQPRVRVGDEV